MGYFIILGKGRGSAQNTICAIIYDHKRSKIVTELITNLWLLASFFILMFSYKQAKNLEVFDELLCMFLWVSFMTHREQEIHFAILNSYKR